MTTTIVRSVTFEPGATGGRSSFQQNVGGYALGSTGIQGRAKHIMLLVRIVLLALVGIYVQGCAVIPDTVSFQYHSQTVPAPIPGAAQVVVQVGVTDVRPGDPRKISNKKNGYGMEMATIRTDRPVDHIVGDALAEELVKDGFQIGPGPVIVAAEVERFANDYKMGFFSGDAVAEVTIAIQVRTLDGRILYARTFSADGTETGVFLMEGHNHGSHWSRHCRSSCPA